MRLAAELDAVAVPPERTPAARVEFVPLDGVSMAAAMVDADLLVNATPVGAWPEAEGCPLPDGVALGPGSIVFDLVYRPRLTRLLRRAAAAGCRTIPDIEMLVEQGARSFELWTGLPAPTGVMRAAAYHSLAEQPDMQAGDEPGRGMTVAR